MNLPILVCAEMLEN